MLKTIAEYERELHEKLFIRSDSNDKYIFLSCIKDKPFNDKYNTKIYRNGEQYVANHSLSFKDSKLVLTIDSIDYYIKSWDFIEGQLCIRASWMNGQQYVIYQEI